MKRCSKCHIEYPYKNFYKNKAQPDGFSNECIPCYKESSRKYRFSQKGKMTREKYLSNPENQAAYKLGKKRYWRSPKAKIVRKQYSQTPKGKEIAREKSRRYQQKNRLKLQAQWAVRNAIRTGKLPKVSTQQCSCGAQATQWHHHHGYEKAYRLDVIPLCTKCHMFIHLHSWQVND